MKGPYLVWQTTVLTAFVEQSFTVVLVGRPPAVSLMHYHRRIFGWLLFRLHVLWFELWPPACCCGNVNLGIATQANVRTPYMHSYNVDWPPRMSERSLLVLSNFFGSLFGVILLFYKFYAIIFTMLDLPYTDASVCAKEAGSLLGPLLNSTLRRRFDCQVWLAAFRWPFFRWPGMLSVSLANNSAPFAVSSTHWVLLGS